MPINRGFPEDQLAALDGVAAVPRSALDSQIPGAPDAVEDPHAHDERSKPQHR
jgi:hypothetical protein